MRFQLCIALLIGFTAFYSCTQSTKKSEVKPETLFAQDADDWITGGDADWKFVDGELIGSLDSGSGFVMTKKSYKNFELTLEFNPDSTVNSGVYLRCKNVEISATDCYEINIWDLHPNQDNRTGAVVTRATPLNKVETLNKWNTYKIRCEDRRIQAWIDNVQTADLQDSQLSEGYIALQAAVGGEIRFRNVQVQPFQPGESK